MEDLLIAIVGDLTSIRTYNPPMTDNAKAKKAAEEIGAELSKRGSRLLVYGGPYLETEVVRGFVAANPPKDKCILKWYASEMQPPAFPEETTHPKLFDTHIL